MLQQSADAHDCGRKNEIDVGECGNGRNVRGKEEEIGEADGDGERFCLAPNEERDGDEAGVGKENQAPSEELEGNHWKRGEAAREKGRGNDEYHQIKSGKQEHQVELEFHRVEEESVKLMGSRKVGGNAIFSVYKSRRRPARVRSADEENDSKFPMSFEIGIKQHVPEGGLPVQQNVETNENSVEFHVLVDVLAAIFALNKLDRAFSVPSVRNRGFHATFDTNGLHRRDRVANVTCSSLTTDSLKRRYWAAALSPHSIQTVRMLRSSHPLFEIHFKTFN